MTLETAQARQDYTETVSLTHLAGRRLFETCAHNEITEEILAEMASLIMQIDRCIELMTERGGRLTWNNLEDGVIHESDPDISRHQSVRSKTVLDRHFEDALYKLGLCWSLYFIPETRTQGLYGMQQAVKELKEGWTGIAQLTRGRYAEESIESTAQEFEQRLPRCMGEYVLEESVNFAT